MGGYVLDSLACLQGSSPPVGLLVLPWGEDVCPVSLHLAPSCLPVVSWSPACSVLKGGADPGMRGVEGELGGVGGKGGPQGGAQETGANVLS